MVRLDLNLLSHGTSPNATTGTISENDEDASIEEDLLAVLRVSSQSLLFLTSCLT